MIRSLYINKRFFLAMGAIAVIFIGTFIIDTPILIPESLFYVFVAFTLTDLLLLYRVRRGLHAERKVPDRMSNGDNNDIFITLHCYYRFPVQLRLLDEVPHQFQYRNLVFRLSMKPGEAQTLKYFLRPVKRGIYEFGAVNVFASSPLNLFSRRFRFDDKKEVPVYPSYLQLRKYELLAISNRLQEAGVKKIRRIGQNREFEMIRDYIHGDDIRTLNWKATARRSRLMVNQFQDERSQQVYAVIDKGRVMQMPFNGMSLLDYAINATLVILNIAIQKFDKAGLITFQDYVETTLPAGRRNNQMGVIQEMLYHQKTGYRESDFSRLYTHIRTRVNQRSLLLLFSNFETLHAMERQLPYLIHLARRHVLVVIFFENTELKTLLQTPATDLKGVYAKAVAEKFSYEKKVMVRELARRGIQSVLTTPDRLTVDTINKYLEIKARQLL